MTLQDAFYSAPSGAIPAGAVLVDDSSRLDSLVIATNEHGYAECVSTAPLGMADVFLRYDIPGIPHRRVSAGCRTVYEGRLEDVAITADGINMTALGYSRSLSDMPYTALWSDTKVSGWRVETASDVAARSPAMYTFDTNNRLFIGLNKGASYANNADAGSMCYLAPDQNSRSIVGISFDYALTVPANWKAEAYAWDAGFTGAVLVWSVTSGGAALTGSINATFAGKQIVTFDLYNNTGGASAPAGESGTNFLKIANLRLVTSTANRINTTLGTNIAAGTRTVTPASMARIYVGQSLQIDQGSATIAESVSVTAITSTTFTAVFAFAHVIASTVNAHVIYADEIAKDLIAITSAANSTQLSTNTALVQSPALDLLNESYQDKFPSDILDYLITLGDNQATPRQWEWAVWDNRFLQFQPRGATAQAWYVDVGSLQVERTFDKLANSAYGVYSDASGRPLRTAASSNAVSIARAGFTRRQAVAVSTTSATQAGIQRDAFLADRASPIPKVAITFDAIYDSGGSRYPLNMVRSGDTITIRNLPPTLSTSIDRIRTFRIVRTMYDAMNDTIMVEPESPLPTLDALLARIAAGLD